MTIPSDAAAGAPLDTAPAVPSGELETEVLIIGSGPAAVLPRWRSPPSGSSIWC